jgi:phosphate transport system substrate-binding protein
MSPLALRLRSAWSTSLILVVASLVATACIGARSSGSVRIDGSSTVFPITEAVAEEYSLATRGVRTTVGFSGTGGGGEKFCRGDIDVWNASRHISESERRACLANGIDDVIELEVAIDALTVVVNVNNTWATCMTTEQVRQLFQHDGARTWADIDPGWPDERIRFYYPGADSGTFDYFLEAMKLRGASRDEPAHRSDGTASEDDNILVRGIEGDRYSLGYFGFAYYQDEAARMRAVAIDNGEGCVEPSFQAALSGDYSPLSRPLFIYVRGSDIRERPEVHGFIQFYLDHMQELAAEVGYVSLPDDRLAAMRERVAPFVPPRESGQPALAPQPVLVRGNGP